MFQFIKFLHSWNQFIRAVESVAIDAIAATAPWLAPVLPAYMVYHSMSTVLIFPYWVSLAGALVVELLGLSSVYTVFQLWDYNRTRRKIDKSAPLIFSIFTAVFYLAVVLTVNVLLDQSTPIHKLAKALLSSLSICAAITLAVRAQHSRRLTAIEADRAQARKDRQERRKLTALVSENSGNLPETPPDWRNLPETDRQRIGALSTRQIVDQYHVPERTARNWRNRARSNGN